MTSADVDPRVTGAPAVHSAATANAPETCAYCELPLTTWLTSGRSATASTSDSPVYCCFGCQFADQIAHHRRDGPHAGGLATRLAIAIFFTMNVMVFTLALWTENVFPEMADPDSATVAALHNVFRYLCLIFSLPVLALLGGPLVQNTFASRRQLFGSTDALLTLGISAAFLHSTVSVIRETGAVYFEVCCMVLLAVTLGRWFEATGKLKTTAALRELEALIPQQVRRWLGPTPQIEDARDTQERAGAAGEAAVLAKSAASSAAQERTAETLASSATASSATASSATASSATLFATKSTATEQLCPTSSIQVDDVLRILPGERIPLDGLVIAGQASLDNQLVTGEAEPEQVRPGMQVHAGGMNLDGQLLCRITRRAGETTIDQIVAIVSRAASAGERYARLADRVAAWFLPAVVGVAVATVGWWSWAGEFPRGLMNSMAVLLVACPCALALTAPMALWASFGRAAKSGNIIRNAHAFVQLGRIDQVFLDKTGTLTDGEVQISQFGWNASSPLAPPWIAIAAAALARTSTHPVAQAVVSAVGPDRDAAGHGGIVDARSPFRSPLAGPLGSSLLEEVHSSAGNGMTGRIPVGTEGIPPELAGQRMYLGHATWLAQQGQQLSPALQALLDLACAEGNSVTLLAWGGHVQAVFVACESIRSDVQQCLGYFRARRLPVTMLTGDHPQRAKAVARQLGIAVESQLLPQQKADRISASQRQGRTVLMIGDGVNDAPALATADVGIALRCGADISRQTADICLLSDKLGQVPALFELAAQTRHTIRWNLWWAFSYNLVAIPLAAAGMLNPIIAALAMVVSSLIVISNSLRLSQEEAQHGPAIGGTAATNPLPADGTDQLLYGASVPLAASLGADDRTPPLAGGAVALQAMPTEPLLGNTRKAR